MSTYAIYADKFVLAGRLVGPGYLPVADGKFGNFSYEKPACEILDKTGKWIAPGLVDIHIHGFYGHATTDIDADGINESSRGLAKFGTTAWCPTTFTNPTETIGREVAAIAEANCKRDANFLGARIAGIFLEGPFFTMKHVGAQNPDYLIDPQYEIFADWQEKAQGLIVRSGLAPEREGSVEYISRLSAEGVTCAIGHSDATYEQCLKAVDAGCTTFLHTYNGMRGLHHREPGVVGAAMTTPDTFAEVIGDGKHVNPISIKVLIETKGWQHTPLITDCLGCGGLPEGHYMSGGLPVEMRDGACYLTEGHNAGSLAGSVARLIDVVKNLYDWNLVTAEQAIRMASEVPARATGIDHSVGFIMPGRNADFIALNPNMTLDATYISGSLVPVE
nr:N-acetylglucosamine-6-phosphate deacetylase [Olegusella massiliensis]